MNPTAPVIKTREIPLPAQEAFRLFTERLDTWWPMSTHSIGASEGGVDSVAVRFEGRIGGQVVEILSDGREYSWGEVIAWNPPERFVITWHPNINPTAASILEVRFTAQGDNATTLYLEHRGWEEFGEHGLELRGQYEPGWDFVLSGYESASSEAASAS